MHHWRAGFPAPGATGPPGGALRRQLYTDAAGLHPKDTFNDFVLHGLFFTDGRGDIEIATGATVPRVPAGDTPVFARDTGEEVANPSAYAFDYQPGTRRIQHAVVRYRRASGEEIVLEYEPLVRFHMAGVGYFHPQWGHGHWRRGRHTVRGQMRHQAKIKR